MENDAEKDVLEELHSWANQRFRPRSATTPSLKFDLSQRSIDLAQPIRKISREGASSRRRLSAHQRPEFTKMSSFESALSCYSSNQTLNEYDATETGKLEKKIEHLEKERDFCLNKLRNIEDLCARFGDMAKDEARAKVPIKKLAAILYAHDEGFIELDEFTDPAKEIQGKPSILDHDDEVFDPTTPTETSGKRKFSLPLSLIQSQAKEFGNLPSSIEGYYVEEENKSTTSGGLTRQEKRSPPRRKEGKIFVATPILDEEDPDRMFD